MEPTLNINDVVVVKKYQPSEFKEGDIITFKQDEKTISHRIEEIVYYGENYFKLKTKGDNNDLPDEQEVEVEQVYGKVIFKVGKIGKIIGYIQNARGFINIGIFIIIIFILVSLKDKQKYTRKMKRKKYEIKKMRDNYHL